MIINAADPEALAELIEELPREEFLDSQILFEDAHYDGLEAPHRMVLSPRQAIRKMVQALELQPSDRVLHIGTSFGFTALVLSYVCDSVVSLERLHHRAHFAREKLARFNRENVVILETDDPSDPAIEGQFQAILVETVEGQVTSPLMARLAPGGRLVVVAGGIRGSQRLLRYRPPVDDEVQREDLGEIRLTPSLVEILVDLGIAAKDHIRDVQELAKSKQIPVTQALQQLGVVEELELYRALALQRKLPFSGTAELIRQIETDALDQLPRPFMKHNQIVPIFRRGDHFLLATPDPNLDVALLQAASRCRDVELVLITPTDYRRLWRAIELNQYGSKADPNGDSDLSAAFAPTINVEDLAEPLQQERVTAIFDGILYDAVAERTSDIHLERYGDQIRVRFRIDGQCIDMEQYKITPEELLGIVNVIKIGSNLDIAERRLPQGGRMSRTIGGKKFDLRIQTQPSYQGEYVVIRLLPRENRLISIEELGFPPQLAREYERLLVSPSGMVLVVGPTGSGKSTTLYAGLQLLADDASRKVITVEDPVEYSIDRVQQTQVKPRIGFHFASAMRSFVRQDPDVILVGEIRDDETALEAIRASQTGHLVLSTLHSNDAVDAIQRLFDLGMKANSVSSELIGVIAQRLARRICPHCRQQVDPDPEIAIEVFPGGIPEDFVCFQGMGCSRCDMRGTRGRIAVIEYLKVDRRIRQAISEKLQVDLLRERCLTSGLTPMRTTALDLIQDGIISLKELQRILPEEKMAPDEVLSS